MGWRSDELERWLVPDRTGDGAYRHVRLDEENTERAHGLDALRELAMRAHADALARLEQLAGISLDPLGRPGRGLGITYPDALHTTTIQGYLGELLAGLVAENFKPHDRDWEVPAFLFRTHDAAFQALERRRQLGGLPRPVPGRTGDDCVAFIRDDDGRIVEWLMCEAKCTHDHDAGLIRRGHEQLSLALRVPVDLLQLIDILRDSTDPDADAWIDAIRVLHQESVRGGAAVRLDLFLYTCGRSPTTRSAWIPDDAPHDKYEGDGPLEAVEIHLAAFDDVLTSVYPDHTVDR